MSATCTGCQRPLAQDARFCPACGTPRPEQAVPRTDERRVATVVIGDVVGFTTLSERLDPEAVKHLVDRLFGRLAEDVTNHGGTVDKVVGDAIVALFGAPVAHEDDPERAVRAALAMQRSVGEVAEALGLPLQMRIGVNSGEVLVGGLAAGDAYTAMGDAVNVASRLEAAAPPGAVLVGPATHQATESVITYRPHATLTVRGRQAPLATWLAERAIGAPGVRPHGTRGPTVGREVEARLLDTVMELVATRRRAHMVAIGGEAGVGKRHLAEAFAERARRRHDAVVVSGRIPPYGEASMWGPAADMLRGALGEVDLEDVDALTAVVAGVLGDPVDSERPAEIAHALTTLFDGGAGGTGPDNARAVASSALVSVMRHIAATRPVVCVLTNIQWADDAIIELMSEVLLGLRHSPVLAITTSRGELVEHAEITQEVLRTINATILRVAPLESDAATSLARSLLGRGAAEATVAAAVQRSGGNPMMLEEIAALAADRGEAGVAELPMTLQGLMSARLDELPADQRRLVEDAAVIGSTGPVSLLAELAAERGESRAAALLDLLVDAHLLIVDSDAYRFRTDAFREAAYLRLPKAERALRHRDIGRRMQAVAGTGGAATRRRAQHLATAAELATAIGVDHPGLVEEALEALREAARWASQRDPGVALRFADRLLALPGAAGDPDARLLRARALADLSRMDAALQAAESLVDTDAPDVVRARAMTVIGHVRQTQGRLSESARVLAEAIALARRCGDDRALAEALQMAAQTRIFQGDDDGARSTAEQAHAAFARLDDPQGMAWTLLQQGWVAFNVGDLSTAERLAEQARPLLSRASDVIGQGLAACLQGFDRFAVGDLVGARTHGEAALVQVSPPEAAGLGNGLARVLLASVALWEGATGEALDEAEAAVGLLGAIGHRWAHMLALVVHARALAHAGRPDAALQGVEHGLSVADTLDAGPGTALVDQAAAATLLHLGLPDRAVPLLTRHPGTPAGPNHARLCALAALQQGDLSAAQESARRSVDLPISPSVDAANHGVAALVLAAADVDGEVEDHVVAVLDNPTASFQDRSMALLARAWVALGREDDGGAEEALLAAEAELEPVQDAPTAALVALALDRVRGSRARAAADVLGPGWLVALRGMGPPVRG